MSEWLKEHAWKACVGETLPRVRIPLSPPIYVTDLGRRDNPRRHAATLAQILRLCSGLRSDTELWPATIDRSANYAATSRRSVYAIWRMRTRAARRSFARAPRYTTRRTETFSATTARISGARFEH